MTRRDDDEEELEVDVMPEEDKDEKRPIYPYLPWVQEAEVRRWIALQEAQFAEPPHDKLLDLAKKIDAFLEGNSSIKHEDARPKVVPMKKD